MIFYTIYDFTVYITVVLFLGVSTYNIYEAREKDKWNCWYLN